MLSREPRMDGPGPSGLVGLPAASTTTLLNTKIYCLSDESTCAACYIFHVLNDVAEMTIKFWLMHFTGKSGKRKDMYASTTHSNFNIQYYITLVILPERRYIRISVYGLNNACNCTKLTRQGLRDFAATQPVVPKLCEQS